MNDGSVPFGVGVFIGGIICFPLGFIIGCSTTAVDDQNLAVREGLAEYYLDANHNRQWRWLPTPTPTPEKEQP